MSDTDWKTLIDDVVGEPPADPDGDAAVVTAARAALTRRRKYVAALSLAGVLAIGAVVPVGLHWLDGLHSSAQPSIGPAQQNPDLKRGVTRNSIEGRHVVTWHHATNEVETAHGWAVRRSQIGVAGPGTIALDLTSRTDEVFLFLTLTGNDDVMIPQPDPDTPTWSSFLRLAREGRLP